MTIKNKNVVFKASQRSFDHITKKQIPRLLKSEEISKHEHLLGLLEVLRALNQMAKLDSVIDVDSLPTGTGDKPAPPEGEIVVSHVDDGDGHDFDASAISIEPHGHRRGDPRINLVKYEEAGDEYDIISVDRPEKRGIGEEEDEEATDESTQKNETEDETDHDTSSEDLEDFGYNEDGIESVPAGMNQSDVKSILEQELSSKLADIGVRWEPGQEGKPTKDIDSDATPADIVKEKEKLIDKWRNSFDLIQAALEKNS